MENQRTTLNEIFGEPIYAYSRAEAIADGSLVDVTATAREAGFTVSVAMTRAAWAGCVEWTANDSKRQAYQDEAGRLWDVLYMCFQAARRSKSSDRFFFCLYRVPRGGKAVTPRLTKLKAIIGPGDDAEPVITILEPDED